MLCAGLFCPMEVRLCCCHPASGEGALGESLGEEEGSRSDIATKFTKPLSAPEGPHLEMALNCRCSVSPPPPERTVELLPKVPGDTFSPKDHDPASAGPLVRANPLPQQAHDLAATITFRLDRSDTYLRTATLRI